MKKIIIAILLLSVILFAGYSFAGEWQDVTGNLSDRSFYAIAGSRYGSAVYTGTENGLYRQVSNTGRWTRIFTCRGEKKGVNDIYVNNKNVIYIATENGFYRSRDLGKNWERLFGEIGKENRATSVICDSKNEDIIYLGTRGGLFRTKNDGKTWKRFSGKLGSSKVVSIASGKNGLFVICDNRVYKIAEDSGNYKRIFGSGFSENLEESEQYGEEEIVSEETTLSLNDITAKGSSVYLATNRGLFISRDSGALWERFDDTGLSERRVNSALAFATSSKIFAATRDGIFEYKGPKYKWEKLYEGMDSANVKKLAITRSGDHVWALCNARIYRMKNLDLKEPSRDAPDTDEIFLSFAEEPNVNEVQAMAIRYAEVYPEKIAKWRRDAKFKAILPKLTFGLDNSVSDTYSLSTNPNYETVVIGPRDTSEGWDLNFTWDLSDLIWNESQTSIDVRSKLMVQLRDDIVDEVTRIYFERRRQQIERVMNPPQNLQAKLKRELRIQELTAGLDGLTGGRFSKAINENG